MLRTSKPFLGFLGMLLMMLCVDMFLSMSKGACGEWERVSMSAEKFFQRESSAFQFVFWALLLFLYDGLGAVFAGLA